MAKVKGPLMSMTASGHFKNRLTYSQRKTGAQVRMQHPQKDKITTARTAWRDNFKTAVAAWNALTTDEKIAYNVRAVSKNITGYNLFLHENIGGVPVTFSFLLLEGSGFLLLESGGKIELE
jgi:hypothetical protein